MDGGQSGLRLLRESVVVERVGYSRVWIRKLERAGKFPRRVKLGPNRIGWLEHEVDGWLAERAGERAPVAA